MAKEEKKKKPSPMDSLLESANHVTAMWMEFRKHFRKAFTNQEITMDEEQRFLELKSNITRLLRILAQNLPEGLDYGAAKINGVMSQAISIDTLREMPLNDKKGLYDEWHAAYIRLENMMGVLDVMREGHKVKFAVQRAKSANIKESIGATEDKKKKSGRGRTIGAVAVLAVLGAVVWYLFFK